MYCFSHPVNLLNVRMKLVKADHQLSCFHHIATVWWQSGDHVRHSPSLVRWTWGCALKRRQAVIFGKANGLFLTSAEHNSAICCRESLSAPHLSLWNREWTNGNLRDALSSWVQDWAHGPFAIHPWLVLNTDTLLSFSLSLTFLSLSSKNIDTHWCPLLATTKMPDFI